MNVVGMDYVPKITILQHPFLITSLEEAMDNRQNIFRHVEAGKLWILSEETVRDELLKSRRISYHQELKSLISEGKKIDIST
jgi:hypothetical protein